MAFLHKMLALLWPARAAAHGKTPQPEAPSPIPILAPHEGLLSRAAIMVSAHEGFRAEAYRCPAGRATIGFGTTLYPDGQPVRLTDPPITREKALALLAYDLKGAVQAVNALVTVPLTENQRVALLSFVYNVGRGAFATSTLLRKLNAGDYAGAAAEFPRWNRAGEQILPGLVKRRAAEAALFRA